MKIIGNTNKRLDKSPYIYRIEILDRFYQLLDNKELVFVNPDKWEDPLENLIFNAQIIKNGKLFKNPAKNNIFAQCWSYEGDSYGIWKIYTTKENDDGITKRHMGVRITTKLDNLPQISRNNNGKYYYGVVNYQPKYKLDKLPKDKNVIEALQKQKPCQRHLETLLIKRKSYSYENELRLFAIPNRLPLIDKNKQLCRLSIEPNEFITSVRFDPGMEYKIFKEHKNKLVNRYGFRASQITQSSYFKKNKYIINLDK